jgi:hypothetical protein
MEAMGNKEDFILTETNSNGEAYGYNETATAVIF